VRGALSALGYLEERSVAVEGSGSVESRGRGGVKALEERSRL
jgi:hypothetical protein